MNITAISENIISEHNERFIWDEHSAFIVFFVFAVLSCLPAFTLFFSCDLFEEKWCERTVWAALIGFMFLVTSILMAIYSRKLEISLKHEYYGPMRITGYTLRQYSEGYSCGTTADIEDTKVCERHLVAADLDVDWGYAWACPSAPQTRCQRPIGGTCSFKICDADSRCTDKKRKAASEKAIACAEQTYYNSSMNYTAYEAGLGPSQDENWPSVLAYGDCESCSARLHVWNTKTLRRMKISGATFFFAGVALFILAVVPWRLWMCSIPWRRFKCSLPSITLPKWKPRHAKEETDIENNLRDLQTSSKETDSSESSRLSRESPHDPCVRPVPKV